MCAKYFHMANSLIITVTPTGKPSAEHQIRRTNKSQGLLRLHKFIISTNVLNLIFFLLITDSKKLY